MIQVKNKYCRECEKTTSHKFQGKECRDWLLRWYNIAWQCEKCGNIHIQNTAHLESETN